MFANYGVLASAGLVCDKVVSRLLTRADEAHFAAWELADAFKFDDLIRDRFDDEPLRGWLNIPADGMIAVTVKPTTKTAKAERWLPAGRFRNRAYTRPCVSIVGRHVSARYAKQQRLIQMDLFRRIVFKWETKSDGGFGILQSGEDCLYHWTPS